MGSFSYSDFNLYPAKYRLYRTATLASTGEIVAISFERVNVSRWQGRNVPVYMLRDGTAIAGSDLADFDFCR